MKYIYIYHQSDDIYDVIYDDDIYDVIYDDDLCCLWLSRSQM